MEKAAHILVLGSGGQLGKCLADVFADRAVYAGHKNADICDSDAIEKLLSAVNPEFVINCAAYTAVDKAESDTAACMAVNADALATVATACRRHNAKLIHISTDYVFDGKSSRPYNEDDRPNPQSVYGLSKLKGEQNITEALPEAVIIRTGWLYSEYGHNFLRTMLRLASTNGHLRVVGDQTGTPTYAADLAKAIATIIDSGKWNSGIYHYGNDGATSWYGFACEIFKANGNDIIVDSITTSEYPTAATRPAYSVLDKNKIKRYYNVDVPDWRDGLRRCLQRINNNGQPH